MPVRGQPRNPLGQQSGRFHRLRPFGGDVRAVDPVGELPNRWHERAHAQVVAVGESPGTMEYDRRPGIEAPGTIRKLWKQLISPVPAPPPFEVSAQPFTGQRAIRFRAASIFRTSGNQLSFARDGVPGLHTRIVMATRQDRATIGSGGARNAPTIRNRVSSFGSRVPPLNPRVEAATGSE